MPLTADGRNLFYNSTPTVVLLRHFFVFSINPFAGPSKFVHFLRFVLFSNTKSFRNILVSFLSLFWPFFLIFVLQDRACEIVEDLEANKMRKMKKRICLVLDCLCAHDFSDKTADLINLQHYVIKEKRLSEREAIVIFYDVVRVVEALHKVSSMIWRTVKEKHHF